MHPPCSAHVRLADGVGNSSLLLVLIGATTLILVLLAQVVLASETPVVDAWRLASGLVFGVGMARVFFRPGAGGKHRSTLAASHDRIADTAEAKAGQDRAD